MDNREGNVKRIGIDFEAWAEPRNIRVYNEIKSQCRKLEFNFNLRLKNKIESKFKLEFKLEIYIYIFFYYYYLTAYKCTFIIYFRKWKMEENSVSTCA